MLICERQRYRTQIQHLQLITRELNILSGFNPCLPDDEDCVVNLDAMCDFQAPDVTLDMGDGSGESYTGASKACEDEVTTTVIPTFPTVPNRNHTAPTDPDTTSLVVIIDETDSIELPSDFIANTAGACTVLLHWTVAMMLLSVST